MRTGRGGKRGSEDSAGFAKRFPCQSHFSNGCAHVFLKKYFLSILNKQISDSLPLYTEGNGLEKEREGGRMGRRCLSHQGALFCTDSRNKGDRGRERRGEG